GSSVLAHVIRQLAESHRSLAASYSNWFWLKRRAGVLTNRPQQDVSAGGPSIEDVVKPLVIECTAGGPELFAKAACMCCHAMRLRGLAVAPQFDDSEVVLPIDLSYHLKAMVAAIPPAVLRKLLDNRSAILPLRWDHVDVGHDCQRRRAARCVDRANRQREMDARISGCDLN